MFIHSDIYLRSHRDSAVFIHSDITFVHIATVLCSYTVTYTFVHTATVLCSYTVTSRQTGQPCSANSRVTVVALLLSKRVFLIVLCAQHTHWFKRLMRTLTLVFTRTRARVHTHTHARICNPPSRMRAHKVQLD